MTKSNMKRSKGYFLIEALLSIVIFSVLVLSVFFND